MLGVGERGGAERGKQLLEFARARLYPCLARRQIRERKLLFRDKRAQFFLFGDGVGKPDFARYFHFALRGFAYFLLEGVVLRFYCFQPVSQVAETEFFVFGNAYLREGVCLLDGFVFAVAERRNLEQPVFVALLTDFNIRNVGVRKAEFCERFGGSRLHDIARKKLEHCVVVDCLEVVGIFRLVEKFQFGAVALGRLLPARMNRNRKQHKQRKKQCRKNPHIAQHEHLDKPAQLLHFQKLPPLEIGRRIGKNVIFVLHKKSVKMFPRPKERRRNLWIRPRRGEFLYQH